MSTYAVGDVQGCLDSLNELLQQARFKPNEDTLWIAGDLVNRGPNSLACLRFAKSLPKVKMVLGNHDLHLLAVARGSRKLNKKDTLSDILEADDREELLDWLQHHPLIYHDESLGYAMVHAGLPPIWSVAEACERASEVQNALRTKDGSEFFMHMYGNTPDCWHDDLRGMERLRVITNYLTRMRFCDAKGRLELTTKTGPESSPPGYRPWYEYQNTKTTTSKILFGHWASLQGRTTNSNCIALDTGCVWGGALTMIRLDDGVLFSRECPLN